MPSQGPFYASSAINLSGATWATPTNATFAPNGTYAVGGSNPSAGSGSFFAQFAAPSLPVGSTLVGLTCALYGHFIGDSSPRISIGVSKDGATLDGSFASTTLPASDGWSDDAGAQNSLGPFGLSSLWWGSDTGLLINTSSGAAAQEYVYIDAIRVTFWYQPSTTGSDTTGVYSVVQMPIDNSALRAHWQPPRPVPYRTQSPRRRFFPGWRPAKPVRVGFLFPRLNMGGAEIWLDTLVSHRDPRIEWSGVNLWLPDSDAALKKSIAEKVSITEGDATTLAESSDVLIAWNVDSIADRVPGFSGPVALVSHGGGEWSAEMASLAGDRATHFAAVSDFAAAAFDGLADRVTTLHNGVDPRRVRRTQCVARTRAAWGLLPGEIAVGYVGRYSWEKNPLAVAIACAELGPRYRPVYVGDGWKRDEVLSAIAQAHPRAIIVPRTDLVGDVLHALDCYVLASPTEGFSLGMIEAWLCGTPVVATPVGAVPEIEAVHGKLVCRVPVCPTPRQLAHAVRRAINERNLPTLDRARQVAAEHFTATAMGRRWCDWLVNEVSA